MTAPMAYSYIRFSSREQAKGDSVRRQASKRDDWCARNNVTLDTSRTLHDLGKSAFKGDHRKNPDTNALAAFLALVDDGKIARGSYLLIESLDRLTREHIVPAVNLFTGILLAGVRIVQLSPIEMIYDDKADMGHIMIAIVELSRGNSESQTKSDRVGNAWANKKQKAATQKTPLTKRLPAWLEMRDGNIVIVPEKADTVRKIFTLASNGYGIKAITKKLNKDATPTIARAKHWALSYVGKLLDNRAVIGEYQPFTRRNGPRRPDGDPVANYFPAIVTPESYHAVQAGLAQRKGKPGRPGKSNVNLFTGMLTDAITGGTFQVQEKGQQGTRSFVSYQGNQGIPGANRTSFPARTFERAILRMLSEIDPAQMSDSNTPDDTLAIQGEIKTIDAKLTELASALLAGPSVTLATVVRQLEARKNELTTKLDQAQQTAATPLTSAWQECQSLLTTLDQAPDQEGARLKLRALLRRVISSVHCIFANRGSERLARVQISFNGTNKVRSLEILHQPARGGNVPHRPGKWWVVSTRYYLTGDAIDLRIPEHAQTEQQALLNFRPDDEESPYIPVGEFGARVASGVYSEIIPDSLKTHQ